MKIDNTQSLLIVERGEYGLAVDLTPRELVVPHVTKRRIYNRRSRSLNQGTAQVALFKACLALCRDTESIPWGVPPMNSVGPLSPLQDHPPPGRVPTMLTRLQGIESQLHESPKG